MNIFILDKNPEKAAKYHCDKHVIKMITETAQLLCNVYHVMEVKHPNWFYQPLRGHSKTIKAWPTKSLANFRWLLSLGVFLTKEYFERYNKDFSDNSFMVAQAIFNYMIYHQPKFDSNKLTKPALAMPDIYKTNDPVQSYRNYYIGEKQSFAKWRNGLKPYWWPY